MLPAWTDRCYLIGNKLFYLFTYTIEEKNKCYFIHVIKRQTGVTFWGTDRCFLFGDKQVLPNWGTNKSYLIGGQTDVTCLGDRQEFLFEGINRCYLIGKVVPVGPSII